MRINVQKRLASKIFKVSPKKVKLDPDKLSEVKEAITKADVKGLIEEGIISKQKKRGVSRTRARKIAVQKRKGRRKGHGSRKGKAGARQPKKLAWMAKIRLQRELLSELKEKKMISGPSFRSLYNKAKGGYFRSKRHIKIYIQEQNLVITNENK